MKKILLIILCLFLWPAFANAQERQEIYIVKVNFDSGRLILGEVSTKQGYVPEKKVEQGEFIYWIRLISFSGKVLDERMFSVNPRRLYAPIEEGEEYEGPSGEVVEEKLETAVILPYFKEGKFIELLSANRSLIEIKDIAYLSDVCGDGTCQEHESAEICINDCPAGGLDDYCDVENSKFDPDCQKINLNSNLSEVTTAEDIVVRSNSYLRYIILAAMFLFVLLFSFGAYRYFQKKNRPIQ